MSEATATDIVHVNHWTMPGVFKQRVTTKDLRIIRLTEDTPWFVQGRGMELKSKSVGAGVHEIWMVER